MSILLIVVWLLRCTFSDVVLAARTVTIMTVNDADQLKLGEHLKFATWNCGGLTFTQRQLCEELEYDILALTETHDDGTLKNSRKFIMSEPAPASDKFSGVALLLSDRVAKCVTHKSSCGSRIVYARIRAKPCNLFVIGVYMPHTGRKANPFAADVRNDIEKVLRQVNQHDCVLLLGDLNCKLGRKQEKLTGKWCIHKHPNKEGESMLDLMRIFKLTAVSTFFQSKRGKSNATYLAKDPRYKPSQIDYILVSSRWATSVKDCKVKWGVSCQRWGRPYDHGLVSCVFASRVKSVVRAATKLDYSILKTSENTRTLFDQNVHANLAALAYNVNNPSESLAHLQKSINDAASSVLPVRKPIPFRKRIVSSRTRMLFEERRREFEVLNNSERKAATKAIANSSREDYREYIDSILTDMEAAERTGNTRKLNILIKSLCKKSNTSDIMPSKDLDGKPMTSKHQLLESWNKFLISKFAMPEIDKNRPKECTVSPEDTLSDEELETCLKGMNNGRTPGWDGIPIEAYQNSISAKQELFRIVRLIWDTEVIPDDFVKGLFVMLYKKKDRNDFSNYRAICLLLHAYKLMSAVIARRLHVDLAAVLPDSQAGFRPARGTRDNVCILKWTISMILRERREAIITFIDYTAAFDSESHQFLDEALSNANVSIKVRRIIQCIFKAASGCVRIRNADGTESYSEVFDIARGVLQGDIFSAIAFIVGLWQTFVRHDSPDAGIVVGTPPYDVHISKLEYADDAGIVDDEVDQSSTRLTGISVGSRSDAAMEISIPKTKAMHIHKKCRVSSTVESEIKALKLKHVCSMCSRDFPTQRGLKIHQARWCDGGKTIRSRTGSLADKAVQLEKRKAKEAERKQVSIEGKLIDNVYMFDYLGSRLQCDGDEKADVQHRMNIAQSTFGSLFHVWNDNRLPLSMKLRLYLTAVCFTFTHACEAWDMTEDVSRMINGFNSRCLHIITRKSYRATATSPDVNLLLTLRKRRLRYLGHILRMDEDRLLRRTFMAYVHGGQIVPPGSLLTDCEELQFEAIVELARDRVGWSNFVESL